MRLRTAGFFVAIAIACAARSARADQAEVCAQAAEGASDARDAGRFHDALARYQTCAVDACPRIVRDDCRAGLASIRSDAPTLIVRVHEKSGADVAAAAITIDGAVVSTEDAAAGVIVDVGAHVVRVSADGFGKSEQSLVVGKLDRGRAVEVVLTPVAPPPPVVPLETTKNRTPAIVVGVGGLVALGVFGVLGSISLAGYDKLSGSCPTKCTQSDIDTAHTEGIIADVALGIGVVALVVATVLWFTAPAKPRIATAALPIGWTW